MSDTINQSNMLRVGTILHGTYRIDGYLASGGFGNTYVATNIQFGERYAIKEFFLKGVTERDENTTTISVSNQENAATFEAQRDKFKKEAVRLRIGEGPVVVAVVAGVGVEHLDAVHHRHADIRDHHMGIPHCDSLIALHPVIALLYLDILAHALHDFTDALAD